MTKTILILGGIMVDKARLITTLLLFFVICPLQGAFGAETDNTVDMRKIAYIESSGCKNMIGDKGKALGCYQLHKGVVIEYNQYKLASYKHKDVMRPDIGLLIANWYMNKRIPAMLRHYKQPDTLENRLTAYNMGIKAVVKGKMASAYINKYNKQ